MNGKGLEESLWEVNQGRGLLSSAEHSAEAGNHEAMVGSRHSKSHVCESPLTGQQPRSRKGGWRDFTASALIYEVRWRDRSVMEAPRNGENTSDAQDPGAGVGVLALMAKKARPG